MSDHDGHTVNVGPVMTPIQCGMCRGFFWQGQIHVCTNARRSTSGADVTIWTEQSGVCPTCHRPYDSDESRTQ